MNDDANQAQDLLIKKELIDDIHDSDEGYVKRASAATSKVTRTQIREEGFQRAILDFDPVDSSELDYFGDSELPGMWFELEPDSPPARSIPYNATPETFTYRAEKYLVLISVITTDEATKNINQLRTYKTDIRQIVNDNMLRDIHTQEDTYFLTQIDRTVGSNKAYADASSIEDQNVTMTNANFGNRQNLKRAVSYLTDRKLPMGVCLVNQRTANELLGLTRDEVGGDKAQDLFLKGLKALERFEVFGIPFISTLKNDLVLNGVMYQFTTKQFLGNALMLEDITVTIKKEYDIIRMRAQEQVGLTIGNTRGVQKLSYTLTDLVAS